MLTVSKLRGWWHSGVLLHVLIVVLLLVRLFVFFKIIWLLRLLGYNAITTVSPSRSHRTHVVVHWLAELLRCLMLIVGIGKILVVVELLLLIRLLRLLIYRFDVQLRHWLWRKSCRISWLFRSWFLSLKQIKSSLERIYVQIHRLVLCCIVLGQKLWPKVYRRDGCWEDFGRRYIHCAR